MADEAERGAGNSPAVTRSIRILDLLAEARGDPRTLTEIARELGLAKSSVSNLCVALEEGGLVRRSSAGYLLGRRTVELGSAFLAGFNQIREFYRVCEESEVLRHQLVQIALLDGAQVLYLAVFEGRQRFPMSASVGDRYPASVTAVGTALLSELTPSRWPNSIGTHSNLVGFTERSTTTLAELQAKAGTHPGTGVRRRRRGGPPHRPRTRHPDSQVAPANRPSRSASPSSTPPDPLTNATPSWPHCAAPRSSDPTPTAHCLTRAAFSLRAPVVH